MSLGTTDVLLETLRFSSSVVDRDLRTAWMRLDCRGLDALTSLEGCALWLYRRLKSMGPDGLDEAFWRPLESVARKTAVWNLALEDHAVTVCEELTRYDIPFVLLKGAAQLMRRDIPFATARLISDIDVLVPRGEAEQAWEILRQHGHRPAEVAVADHFHLRQLESPSGVVVEIHTSISNELEPDEAWRRIHTSARCLPMSCGTVLVPSTTEALWHAIVHALNHESHGFRMRFFLDAAAILAADHLIDWTVVEARMCPPEVTHRERALAWLAAAAWMAGVPLPESVAAEPFPVRRVMAWRLAVLRRWAQSPRSARMLIDEATRIESGMPVAQPFGSVPAWVTARRHLTAHVARIVYRSWKGTRWALGTR